MRIARLSLDFFGQFTGKTYDFTTPAGASDFHLIHGPNEAGKTTTMEGYLRLLYGFPQRDPYAFQHPRNNLRVSGLLDIGGTAHPFTRLSTRNGNLRGAADAILPETAIASHLAGLSLDDYRSLLCLDDATIEKGGEDIANARGDIGRLLFSAAAGVADLNAVLEQARTEAAGLYKKRSSSTRLAGLKRELAEVDAAIREIDISAHAWRKLKEALVAAQADEAGARNARNACRAEQAQVAALRRALPALGEIDRLLAELADHGDFPDTIDINPEALVRLRTELGQAEAEVERLQASLAENGAARADLVLDPERLLLAGKLDDLDELRSRMQTALLDLPRRERACEDARADMARIARDLGAPEDCDVAALVRSPAEISALERLRDAIRDAAGARRAGTVEIEELEGRVREDRKLVEAVQDDQPAHTGLIDLLARFDAEALAPAAAAARQAMASADAALRDALDALGIGGCRFAEVPDCPVDAATAAGLAADHAAMKDKVARAEDEVAQLDQHIAAIAARLERLAETAQVAGDPEAREARAERDALWQAHRADLSAESADRFAPAMRAVDEIDAARLLQASTLGEMRKLDQDLAETRARAEATRARREALEAEAAGSEAQAHEIAQALGLPALSPRSLSEWIALRDKAALAGRQRDRLAEQHHDTLERAGRLLAALAPLVGLDTPGFEAALAAARRMAEAERTQRDRLRAATEALAARERDLERRRQSQAGLVARDEEAAAAWSAGVQELFGDTLLPDALAAAPGQLRELREHDARRMQALRQVTTMQDDQRRFTQQVADLGNRFGIAHDDPLALFRRLRQVATQAQDEKVRHDGLTARLEQDARDLTKFEARVQDIHRTVAELAAVFPETVDTTTLDALRIAVGTACDVIARRARIASLREQILGDLSLGDLDAVRALVGGATAPALEAREAALTAEADLAEHRLSAATETRANAQRDLAAVNGGAEIAELVERRATLQLQIEETVLDYLEQDLGLRLAEEAIRRYRDRHRSEMMAATERAFRDLTNGAYDRLLTQPDGASEILLAVDASGASKQIGDMSKGTRFQLYLALRAAAYEQLVAQGVQLPFFCDDVFETFDEDRTRSACRLMERIGRSGQAIYLTHHRHVVDIAREVCDPPPVVHMI